MGTTLHHQTKAPEFLQRADRAIAAGDSTEAAAALRRAASHIVTAFAVHIDWWHRTKRRLEYLLQFAISSEILSRRHLRTFRHCYTLPAILAGQPPRAGSWPGHAAATRAPNGRTTRAAPDAQADADVSPGAPAPFPIRRLRRRVASLISDINSHIAGATKPVQHHKLFLRKDIPPMPELFTVRNILDLPNFEEIKDKFRLWHISMEARPDPHGFYERNDNPRRCPCHADLWDKWDDPKNNSRRFTMAPPWHRALEKTFGVKLPNPLTVTA